MQTLMRFFFHHFYHAFAWTYDFVAAIVSVGRWNGWVASVLPHLRGPSVLELGFGPGHLQVRLREMGWRAVGLDEARQMGRLAFMQLTKNRFPPYLSRGYAQLLPFGRKTFDQVVATFPSEYIFDPRTLAEVYRVLRPGGKFVVALTAWIGGIGLWARLADWAFRITGQGSELTEAAGEELRAHFAQAGFRVELFRAASGPDAVLIIIAEK